MGQDNGRIYCKNNISRYDTTVICCYNIGVGIGYRSFVWVNSCWFYRQRFGCNVGRKSCSRCRCYRPRVRCYRQGVAVHDIQSRSRCRQADRISSCTYVDARNFAFCNFHRSCCCTIVSISNGNPVCICRKVGNSVARAVDRPCIIGSVPCIGIVWCCCRWGSISRRCNSRTYRLVGTGRNNIGWINCNCQKRRLANINGCRYRTIVAIAYIYIIGKGCIAFGCNSRERMLLVIVARRMFIT